MSQIPPLVSKLNIRDAFLGSPLLLDAMPPPFPDDPDPTNTDHPAAEIPSANADEILRWLEQLKRSDRALYNLMALEVWAIAQTMDNLIPGFWSRFMANRQLALHEFLAHRHTPPVNFSPTDPESPDPERNSDGMMESESEE